MTRKTLRQLFAREVAPQWCLPYFIVVYFLFCAIMVNAQKTPGSFIYSGKYAHSGSNFKGLNIDLKYAGKSRVGLGIWYTFNDHYRPVEHIYAYLYSARATNWRQRFAVSAFGEFKLLETRNARWFLRVEGIYGQKGLGGTTYLYYKSVFDNSYAEPEIYLRLTEPIKYFNEYVIGHIMESMLSLHMEYPLTKHLSFTQDIGFGFGYYPGFEHIIHPGTPPIELIGPGYSVGLSYHLRKQEVRHETTVRQKHSLTAGYAIGALSNPAFITYNLHLGKHQVSGGLNYTFWNYPSYENKVFYNRGLPENFKESIGLEFGYAYQLPAVGPLKTLAFLNVQVKKMGLMVNYYDVYPDKKLPPDTMYNIHDGTLYRLYDYKSPHPVTAIETTAGLGFTIDLSEKFFLDQRFGMGMGYYIHEFESYFPGPRKNTEFISPFYKCGLGFRL